MASDMTLARPVRDSKRITAATPVLSSLPGNFVDLRDLPADAYLVAELRTLNAQQGSDSPRLFALVLDETKADDLWGSGPSVWLNAGIGGATGLLRWVDDTGSYSPSDRTESSRSDGM
jgi:hypothetical protein